MIPVGQVDEAEPEDEDLPYDSMLERFRAVRDEIELRMRGWLEQPEAELRRMREKRERKRRERLEAEEREREREAAHAGRAAPEGEVVRWRLRGFKAEDPWFGPS